MATPFETAEQWYDEESIAAAIQRQRRPLSNGFRDEAWPMPTDVYSPEFAKWLTHQYRLAMAKGIQLARQESTT